MRHHVTILQLTGVRMRLEHLYAVRLRLALTQNLTLTLTLTLTNFGLALTSTLTLTLNKPRLDVYTRYEMSGRRPNVGRTPVRSKG